MCVENWPRAARFFVFACLSYTMYFVIFPGLSLFSLWFIIFHYSLFVEMSFVLRIIGGKPAEGSSVTSNVPTRSSTRKNGSGLQTTQH